MRLRISPLIGVKTSSRFFPKICGSGVFCGFLGSAGLRFFRFLGGLALGGFPRGLAGFLEGLGGRGGRASLTMGRGWGLGGCLAARILAALGRIPRLAKLLSLASLTLRYRLPS